MDDAQDIHEAIDAAQTEIDLWEEGQESELTRENIKEIKRWIARVLAERK